MEMAKARRMKKCNNALLELKELPVEILVEILGRFPAEELVCCIRCVSKPWKDMVDSLSFVALHTSFLTATNAIAQVPQLMSFTRYGPTFGSGHLAAMQSLKYHGSTSLLKGNYAIQVSTSTTAKHDYDSTIYAVDFVFCNLFCFRNYTKRDGSCFLINPLKGEVLRLPAASNIPSSGAIQFVDTYAMGFDNTTGKHKIVRVSSSYCPTDEKRIMSTQVLVLGTSSWREVPSVPPCTLTGIKNVSAYGDSHWLIVWERRCHIISFDFKKEEFCLIPHPRLQSSTSEYDFFSYLFLLTLKGFMAMVDTSMLGSIEIWLLKDYEKKEWTRDYTIKTRMFKLDLNIRLTAASCGEWEHGIFLENNKRGKNGTMFFLDLRSASINPVSFGSGRFTRVHSYTGSLISLKDYVNFVEAETCSGSLKTYGRLIEGEAQGFIFSEKHMLRRISSIGEGEL